MQSAVHPHARGEHLSPIAKIMGFNGSSPRPWGTHLYVSELFQRGRFIPTPVGNTCPRSCCPMTGPVHPHARGEHGIIYALLDANFGSSPRPWGTPRSAGGSSDDARFIPTPVGNTPPFTSPWSGWTVHPHARGEHSRGTRRKGINTGSSPRPWGTQDLEYLLMRQRRFIPTPVGNTLRYSATSYFRAVHPHARGEHEIAPDCRDYVDGSSPRPWGTRPYRQEHLVLGRFIPTPVGNTGSWWPEMNSNAVHPHARGEHESIRGIASLAPGSSPRPWGTRQTIRPRHILSRFIPTPVGNTGHYSDFDFSPTVHPHARGEHEKHPFDEKWWVGSSPRPWGTPLAASPAPTVRRFIPTPVGNTISPVVP